MIHFPLREVDDLFGMLDRVDEKHVAFAVVCLT